MSKKKDKDVSTEELFAKLCVSTAKYLQDSTFLFAEMYDNQYKMYTNLLINHCENEPFKFLKKAHKRWEEEKEELEQKKESAFGKYMKECNELYELVEFTNHKMCD